MKWAMVSAVSRPTLAKNARMGHPLFVVGQKQTVLKAGPPAKKRKDGAPSVGVVQLQRWATRPGRIAIFLNACDEP